MRYVFRACPGHVAACAVLVFRVVLDGKAGTAVAGKAFGAEECGLIRWSRREVRVVAAVARHAIAADALAGALA